MGAVTPEAAAGAGPAAAEPPRVAAGPMSRAAVPLWAARRAPGRSLPSTVPPLLAHPHRLDAQRRQLRAELLGRNVASAIPIVGDEHALRAIFPQHRAMIIGHMRGHPPNSPRPRPRRRPHPHPRRWQPSRQGSRPTRRPPRPRRLPTRRRSGLPPDRRTETEHAERAARRRRVHAPADRATDCSPDHDRGQDRNESPIGIRPNQRSLPVNLYASRKLPQRSGR